VSGEGTLRDSPPILLSTAANPQWTPEVAFDGTNHFVVWEDRRSGTPHIYGARISPSGTILDGAGIAISGAADTQTLPKVSFDGANYLVVWHHTATSASEIRAARVSPTGTVLDSTGFTVTTADGAQTRPVDLAFDGTNYLVVWGTSLSSTSDIRGARVSPAGTVLDPTGIAISTSSGSQRWPAVSFDGTNYLVVWDDGRSGGRDIYGARVGPDGVVLDGAGIPVSTAADSQQEPDVTFDGNGHHLVVWSDRRSGTDYDVYGAGVTTAGAVEPAEAFLISGGAGDQSVPRVAVNGPIQVVWRDRRSGTNWDVYGSQVTPEGVGASFAIASSATDEGAPAVSSGPAGNARFGIVYDRFAPEVPYGSNRVFLRTTPK
jgi:hypothetical protein